MPFHGLALAVLTLRASASAFTVDGGANVYGSLSTEAGPASSVFSAVVFPGPRPQSYIVPNFFRRQAVCNQLVKPADGPPAVCGALLNRRGAGSRSRAHERPLHCLKDKLNGPDGIYARACFMCSQPGLDGFAWAAIDRAGLPCTKRYQVINRMATAVMRQDQTVLKYLTRANMFVGKYRGQHLNVDSALAAPGGMRLLQGTEMFADLDDDGLLSREEAKTFLQAVYVFADSVRELTQMDSGANMPYDLSAELHAFSSSGIGMMSDWVDFVPGGFKVPSPGAP